MHFLNEHGTIVSTENGYGVAFDNNIGGHSCGSICEYGYGWSFPVSSRYLCAEEDSAAFPQDCIDIPFLMEVL